MILLSHNFAQGARIPSEFAYARIGVSPSEPMQLAENRNPHLQWLDAPANTRSFALLCIDSDVPSEFTHINQPGHSLAASMPRQDFVHWVMVDIASSVSELAAGSCAAGTPKGGKQQPAGPATARQGINDYTGFMGDGQYFGYDGPCPPWNDLKLHHYHFRLYALDVESLDLNGAFTAADAMAAMRTHVLATAELTGTYSLNPAV
jgi:hypothetical protein